MLERVEEVDVRGPQSNYCFGSGKDVAWVPVVQRSSGLPGLMEWDQMTIYRAHSRAARKKMN